MKYGVSSPKYCPACTHPKDAHLVRYHHKGKTEEGYNIESVTLLCRMYGCNCEYEIEAP